MTELKGPPGKTDREAAAEVADTSPAKTQEPAGGQEPEGFETDLLQEALSVKITPLERTGALTTQREDSAAVQESLEEIAEDMLNLLQRVKSIEERQVHLSAQVEQLQQALPQMARAQSQEISTLRTDILGDRKSQAGLSVCKALIPWLDSLRTMRAKLPKKDKQGSRLRPQLNVIIDAVTMMVQSLGFQEFHATPGEPFDPKRMECTGYLPGKPGVVLETERPGYLGGDIIVRPAGVRLGAPSSTPQTGRKGKST